MLNIEVVRNIVEPLLNEALANFGLEKVMLVEDRDHDDEEVLRAHFYYKKNAPELDVRELLAGLKCATDALNKQGDYRFIHTSHHYQDGPVAEEDYKPTKLRRRMA